MCMGKIASFCADLSHTCTRSAISLVVLHNILEYIFYPLLCSNSGACYLLLHTSDSTKGKLILATVVVRSVRRCFDCANCVDDGWWWCPTLSKWKVWSLYNLHLHTSVVWVWAWSTLVCTHTVHTKSVCLIKFWSGSAQNRRAPYNSYDMELWSCMTTVMDKRSVQLKTFHK
jgi:hypothetical protein